MSDEDLEEDEEDDSDDFYYDDQDDDYRSPADMYEDKAYYYMCKMECILEDEVTNTDPVTQCIQGVRIFHSAKYNQAAEWYRKSAEQGYPIAMCYYAECLVKGVGGVKKNYDEAEGWYIKAIESGLNYALLWLGDFYLENSKIYSNAVENALECYELAAECGVYDAYKKLYKCYSGETKYPFAKDEEKSAKYLRIAEHENLPEFPVRNYCADRSFGYDVEAILSIHDRFK